MIRILILILLLFFPIGARANPFRSSYVCLPNVDPSAIQLEFQVREGTTCQDNEHLVRVMPQQDGSILLIPSEAPSSPEQQKELEEFKKYYGIDH